MIGISESDGGTKRATAKQIAEDAEVIMEEVKSEVESIWEKIHSRSIDLCPKETGALASSIKVLEGGLTLGGESGSGVKSVTGGPSTGGDIIFDRTITAGSEDIINPISKKSTAEYASWVHDGHTMRDGMFWEGVPFLVWALMEYEAELQDVVDRAMQKLKGGGKE